MTQGLLILRGCFAAYAAGVVVITLGNAMTSSRGMEAFGAVALFGVFAMVPLTLAALGIWYVLARRVTTVSAALGIAICGAAWALFGAIIGIVGEGGLGGLAISAGAFFIGCLFGVAFWFGAFGLSRSAVLSLEKP